MVFLLWFSVACFWGQSFDEVSPYVCFIIFNWVAEWPPFRKELLTRLTIGSLCILTICNFSCFPFWFWGRIWVLIPPVSGHSILVNVKNKETKIQASNQIRQESVCFAKEATGKFLNFRTPKNFAVIYLKFKQRSQTLVYFVKMMQME